MSAWLKCRERFIVGDVVRWHEPVWKKRGPKRRAVKVGERLVTAEVIRESERAGFVDLVIIDCALQKDRSGGKKAYGIAKGTETSRMRKNIAGGKAERMLWPGADGEDARAEILADKSGAYWRKPVKAKAYATDSSS